MSWTKFYRHTHVKSKRKPDEDYIRKLSQEQVDSIRQHYEGDDVSFPLPDKKISGQKIHEVQSQEKCKNVQYVQQYNKEDFCCYISQI